MMGILILASRFFMVSLECQAALSSRMIVDIYHIGFSTSSWRFKLTKKRVITSASVLAWVNA